MGVLDMWSNLCAHVDERYASPVIKATPSSVNLIQNNETWLREKNYYILLEMALF
jgi:hypothetical protein